MLAGVLSDIDWVMIIGCLLAGALNVHRPRAILWVLLVGLDYLLSDVVWRSHIPHADGMVALFDAGVVLSVYAWGRERWEMVIMRLYRLSMLVGVVSLIGSSHFDIRIGDVLIYFPEVDHVLYSVLLELINAAFLLWVIGTGLIEGARVSDAVGRSGLAGWYRRAVSLARLALVAKRTHQPFWARKHS